MKFLSLVVLTLSALLILLHQGESAMVSRCGSNYELIPTIPAEIHGSNVGLQSNSLGDCSLSSNGETPGGVARFLYGTGATLPCQSLTVNTCNGQQSIDTTMRVFSGDCRLPQCEGSSDDAVSCGLQSSVTFTLHPNTSYYIEVAGFDGEEGSFTLVLMCPATAPLVQSLNVLTQLPVVGSPVTFRVTVEDLDYHNYTIFYDATGDHNPDGIVASIEGQTEYLFNYVYSQAGQYCVGVCVDDSYPFSGRCTWDTIICNGIATRSEPTHHTNKRLLAVAGVPVTVLESIPSGKIINQNDSFQEVF